MQRLQGPVNSLIVYLVPVGAINRKSPAIRTGHCARARRVARPRAERAGRLDEAEDVPRASLARTPSNGWALSGLVAVYRKRERERFETTWLGKPQGPALSAL